MTPRPYQARSIEEIDAGWNEFSKQVAVLPTGSGKTIIFSWLAERNLPNRTLILAHREELIDQAIEKLHAATGIMAAKEKAESTASLNAQVVVASVQTMIRRLNKWPKDHFTLVVADEAHHAISDSWQSVLNHFNARILGVTATPDRGDKRNLGAYFENIASEVTLVELIKDGYLCPITIKSVPLEIDLSSVHLQAGDFNETELGHALEPYLDRIALAIRTHASFRKVLAFLPLIDTSIKFTEACVRAGIKAVHIDGMSKDRKEILAAFASNDFDLLSNAMLLTEGYDCKDIDCIVILRPTKSRPLYAQMVGRGTRIEETKENLLVLDFLWLHEKHHIIKPADLLAKDEAEGDAINQIIAEKTASSEQEEFDLLDLLSEAQASAEAKLIEHLKEMAKRKPIFISADQFCVNNGKPGVAGYEPTMAWESKPVTDAQRKYLQQASLDMLTINGRGHASALLNILFAKKDLELATSKQIWVMRQKGYKDAHKATKADARKFFTKLSKIEAARKSYDAKLKSEEFEKPAMIADDGEEPF